jgi:hypothetical protein
MLTARSLGSTISVPAFARGDVTKLRNEHGQRLGWPAGPGLPVENEVLGEGRDRNSYLRVFLFLAVYAASLAWLLPKLSLWLDEILDLMAARLATVESVIAYIRVAPGAVPLNYLAQSAAIHIFGLSSFAGRLPSAISSVLSCIGIYFLARRIRLRWPLFPVVVFALCPFQLRYALEARGYALALTFSIWSTVLFLSIVRRPRALGRLILYGLCVVAGLYTQPFSLFVPLSHLTWAILAKDIENKKSLLTSVVLANVVAICLFFPWYLYASEAWKDSVAAAQQRGDLNLRAIPMVLRELVGMGYIGTGLMLTGIAFAAKRGSACRPDRLFWVLSLLVPIGCVFLADAGFGYFLAIRQMIFVLAPISILFCLGVETLVQRSFKIGAALLMAVLIAALWGDIRLFVRPRENWQMAAGLLETEVGEGGCVWFAPANSIHLYSFFRPEVARAECTADSLRKTARVVLAISPYDLEKKYSSAQRELLNTGFLKRGELNPNGPRIELYSRK